MALEEVIDATLMGADADETLDQLRDRIANAVRAFLGSDEVVYAIMKPAYERGYDEGAIDQTEGGAHPDARREGWVQYRADARAALSSIGGE